MKHRLVSFRYKYEVKSILLHHGCCNNAIQKVSPTQKLLSLILYKNIRFRMFYVDLTNPAKRIQNCSNFSFIIDFSWRSSIPGTLDGGRICWLLSEILFFRPKMNKQKSDLALKKAVSYVMHRMCQPVWFHIHLPEILDK